MPKGVGAGNGEVDPEAVAAEIEAAGDVDLEDLPPAGSEQRRRDDPLDDDERHDRKPNGLEYHADPRDDLIRNFRKNRAEQGRELSADYEDEADEDKQEFDEAGNPVDEDDGADPEVQIVAGPGAREVNQPREDKPAPRVYDLRDDDIVITQVDGQKVEMTFKEMKDRAQKDAAADNRLETLNAALDEVRGIAAQIKNPAPAARQDDRPGERPVGDQPGAAPASSKTKEELAAQLTAAIDSIQTDTPEKAANALAEIFAEHLGSQTNAPDVQQLVRETMATERQASGIVSRATEEISTAFASVSDTFGDIIGDERLGNSAYGDVVKAVVKGLHEIGVPDEDFVGLSQAELIQEYAKLRQDANWRDKLTPLNDLFFKAAGDVRAWRTGSVEVPASDKGKPYKPAAGGTPRTQANGGQPQAQGNGTPRVLRTTDRGARKQGVNLQPRSASVRSDFSGNAAPGTRKNASATVAEMAASRK